MRRELDPLVNAALVVAHPDDEALWFSSIVGRVSRVVICYEECADLPHLGPARRAVARAHPLSTSIWLRHPEPCALGRVDWKHPVATEYGLALNATDVDPESERRYLSAFSKLRTELDGALRGFDSIFTHNPWGEYGHPDHVQVSSVVRSLQSSHGFTLRYSNYIAPRSMRLAAASLPKLVSDMTQATDGELFARIKTVYREHGGWTWDSNYEPPAWEAFLIEASEPPSEAVSLPLTCLMTV